MEPEEIYSIGLSPHHQQIEKQAKELFNSISEPKRQKKFTTQTLLLKVSAKIIGHCIGGELHFN